MATVSFIVPAYNEEALLPRTLRALDESANALSLDYEIVVADDESTDATREIAAEFNAIVVRKLNRQIAATRNSGASHAQGDFLFFVDADTVVTTEAVREGLEAVLAGAVGGGSRVKFDGPVPIWASAIIMPLVRLYLAFGLAPGCFIFCTRAAFDNVGGFNEQMFAGEETDFSLRLRRLGKFVITKSHVITSGRKVRAHSAWEILRTGRLMLRREGRLADREGLEMWYQPKRDVS